MSLVDKDLRHLWHPYSDIGAMERNGFPVMVSASGVRLIDDSGKEYLDGISSWWCVNLGHGHPRIVNAIVQQARTLQHSIIGGMSHTMAGELAERLAEIAPEGLERVYLASDGASAVEAAVRIALQYWWNTGRPEKKGIISIEGGYHGDTLGAVGLGFVPRFHRPVAHVVNRSMQAPSPHCFHCPYGLLPQDCGTMCFHGMEKLVRENAASTAAVIAEPVCQGASGIRIYPAEYVRRLRDLCTEEGVLLILDEIAVGFGRTGELFASDLAGISPDILILGKSLTGGYLPMSAAVVTGEIYDSFRSTPEMDRTFYHGHTFAGNPIAAAAACEVLSIFRESGVPEPSVEFHQAFRDMEGMEGVHRSAALGWMGAIEIEAAAGGVRTAARAASIALSEGLLIRPLGPVLYLWPPLVSTAEAISLMTGISAWSVKKALEER